MKRIVLGLTCGCLVGAIGGAGIAVMRAPPPKAAEAARQPTDSTSTHVGTMPGAPAAQLPADPRPADEPAPAAPIAAQGATAGPRAPASAAVAGKKGTSLTPTAVPAGARADSAGAANKASDINAGDRRLAKIFGAMQPKEAARVLDQMSDGDIRVIVGLLTEKQAAAVLSALSPQHAAAVARLTARVAGDGK